MDKSIIFMGTPEFAAHILERLISEGFNIVCVVTQPDKPFGRKKILKQSEVKDVALKHNIEVFQPIKIREDYQKIVDINPDLIITAAYGQIVPQAVLDAPKIMAVNIHGSLLPKYRGGAPIHYSVINGDEKTGVTIMEMIDKMDAGGIITQAELPIEFTDNVGDVYSKMKKVGADLIVKTLPSLLNNNFKVIQQDEDLVTYSPNIKPSEEIIDFNRPVLDVYNQIRGLNPFPVAYFKYEDKRFKVYKAEIKNDSSIVGMIMNISKEGIEIGCEDGIIVLKEIQPEGKKRVLVSDYVNGNVELEINKTCD